MKKTFTIDYDYGIMYDKCIKIHNCINEFDAKSRLHSYLVKKHGESTLVIRDCREDVLDMFGGIFKDIFK